MNTIVVEYNPKDKLTNCLIEALSNIKSVKINSYINFQKEEECSYDPEFVEKILRSRASKGTKIAKEDLWKLS